MSKYKDQIESEMKLTPEEKEMLNKVSDKKEILMTSNAILKKYTKLVIKVPELIEIENDQGIIYVRLTNKAKNMLKQQMELF